MTIGTQKVCHIAFVVSDIKAVTKRWSEILGVSMPDISYLPGPDDIPCYTDGKPGDYSDVQISVIQLENILLEFVQPGKNPSPWRTFMDEHGEGVQHISFVVPDKHKALDAVKEVTGSAPFHAGYYPGGSYIFLDTFSKLGCEINIKADEDNTSRIAEYKQDPGASLEEY